MRDFKNSFISDVKKSADIVEREQRTILNKFHSSGFISSSAINEIAQVYLLAQQKLENEILAFECFIEISKRLGFHSVSNNDFIVLSNNYFYNTHFEDILTLLQNIAEQLQSLKKSKMPRKRPKINRVAKLPNFCKKNALRLNMSGLRAFFRQPVEAKNNKK